MLRQKAIICDPKVPHNRPISLLPVLSKEVEKIVPTLQVQSGNSKYHSTETLSLIVTNHILTAMDEKKLTAMVLINLSKAFDSISHETLLFKLCNLGASVPEMVQKLHYQSLAVLLTWHLTKNLQLHIGHLRDPS